MCPLQGFVVTAIQWYFLISSSLVSIEVLTEIGTYNCSQQCCLRGELLSAAPLLAWGGWWEPHPVDKGKAEDQAKDSSSWAALHLFVCVSSLQQLAEPVVLSYRVLCHLVGIVCSLL